MLILDANAILRYILFDNGEMATQVDKLISNHTVIIKYEVLAEVVYVLEKIYSLPRNKIKDGIEIFLTLPNVRIESLKSAIFALETYETVKIDFVDALLYAYKAIESIDVFTFDKKLVTLISRL